MSGGQYLGNDDGSCHERVLPAFFIETMFKKARTTIEHMLNNSSYKNDIQFRRNNSCRSYHILTLRASLLFPLEPQGFAGLLKK